MDSASSTSTGHVTGGGDHLRRVVAVGAASPDSRRRRSSTFSDYSLSEARRGLQDDIYNRGVVVETQESHNWASIPLAFALLPALAGIFFNNGSSIITDIMLLGLAAVFLRWSVTQPWTWYHSAQGIRVREERMAEVALDDESEVEDGSTPSPTSTAEGGSPKPVGDKAASEAVRQAHRALNELYVHEVLALISCFGFPMLGAYLLHTIRSQLSRPSEGLVSNYNLTIFVLAAEMHPLSHLMKLVQARTLHLQRLVHANPHRVDDAPGISMMQDMARRVEELETRAAAAAAAAGAAQNGHTATATTAKQSRQETAALVREVRNVIQPDLDALNRAVRRYEKKATVLAFQTESRFASVDMRLHDAIALAAAAAKNSSSGAAGSRWGVLGWLVDRLAWTVTLPFQAVVGMVVLPFRTLSGLFWPQSQPSHDRDQRDRRAGKATPAKGRPGPVVDRVPSRLSRR